MRLALIFTGEIATLKYQGEPEYRHDSLERLGVLLVNLGTPDAPTTRAVRRYLAEFLWDPRVIELPRWLWWLVLHGVILRVRPRRSAEAYRKVWTNKGSPLLVHSRRQAEALQTELSRLIPGPVHVVLGMRYGQPSISEALQALRSEGCRRLLVLPLYPQYSATTTGSVFDALAEELKTWRWLPELRLINQYHDDRRYVETIADSIRGSWSERPRAQKLLMSFHGLPRRYLLEGDPYHCECQKTARLVADELNLPPDQWAVAFQSRVGREEWLKPYTDLTLKEWAASGVKSVDVVCPGFPADCLETLEEIGEQNRDFFLEAGGEAYHYIPCLNDRPDHIEALADLLLRHAAGWPQTTGEWDEGQLQAEAMATRERAIRQGAER